MSWNRKTNNRYSRQAERDEVTYWITLFNEELCGYDYDELWDDNSWMFYTWGTPANMDEYHQMKVLTLLRYLKLDGAGDICEYNGW